MSEPVYILTKYDGIQPCDEMSFTQTPGLLNIEVEDGVFVQFAFSCERVFKQREIVDEKGMPRYEVQIDSVSNKCYLPVKEEK